MTLSRDQMMALLKANVLFSEDYREFLYELDDTEFRVEFEYQKGGSEWPIQPQE